TTMTVHLKGDAICTLFLLVVLCSSLPTGTFSPSRKQRADTEEAFMANNRVQTTTPSLLSDSAFNFKCYLLNKVNRKFNHLINQPKKCRTPGGPFLLIAIKLAVEDFDRREIVHKTWGREGLVNGEQIQQVFFLGTSKNRTTLIHQKNFMDTFFNLTLKEIHFLNWAAEFCHNVKFIFKGDDNVFVNVENTVDFFERHDPSEDLFVGDNARPIHVQKSKYYIPETMYGLSIYPAYAEGGGVLLSSNTMRKLSRACRKVELFPIDNIFLSMCLQKINLKPISREGFKNFGIVKPSAALHLQTFDPCFFKDLMVLMWNLLQSPWLSCTQKKQVKKPFQWKKKEFADSIFAHTQTM
uniref:Hexosyltransferase n=1 Tax=Amazona collaria TaxID=241587 RepID=A0A8B9IU53_9PSIT